MISAWWSKLREWFAGLFARQSKPRRAVFFEGDELPEHLPPYDLAVARENDTLWAAGLVCPCGCGRRLEVMLLPDVEPRWDFKIDNKGMPTLHPSIWVSDGCRAHFFLKNGLIVWC